MDDELNILNSIKRSVIFEDYTVMIAMNGQKAIEIIANNDISVIVSDMKMPNMNGFDLLKKVKEISPDTIRIVLSGYNQLTQILATVNSIGVFKYITKPWNDELELLPVIREAVNYYNMKLENDNIKKELEDKNAKYRDLLITKEELIKKTELDVINIKTINNSVLKIQRALFSKLKINVNYLDISEYYLELINGIHTKFLDTFPTFIEKFSIKRFIEILAEETDNMVEFDVDDLDFSHTGDFRLILLVTIELLKYLIEKHNIEEMSVKIRSYPILNIKFISRNENLYNYYNGNIECKFIINFLRELMRTSGGNLLVQEKSGNEILLVANTKI